MSSGADTFTRWGVVASGEGGGRIASELFARTANPGIEDRILVMNTNRADIRNTLDRIRAQVSGGGTDETEKYAVEFGSVQGAGNFFVAGRDCAREDLPRIVRSINQRFGGTDALMHLTTLGGGTGNGSIPYVVSQFKSGLSDLEGDDTKLHEPWMDSLNHAAFGVWPYYYEAPQRHFNAVSGLSRLLKNPDGSQNADMVILAANSHVNGEENDNYALVNRRIIQAIDLMIGAGRKTRGVIDVEDYVRVPSQIGSYHFTPGLVEDIDGTVFELEYLFDRAAENAYVPLDIGTVQVAFAVVRAPERLIEQGDVTEPTVKRRFQEWKRENGMGSAIGMTTLTPKETRSDGMDVLLMLGGFDLGPLLDHSWDQFEQFKENLGIGSRSGQSRLSQDELRRIEQNLRDYRERTH